MRKSWSLAYVGNSLMEYVIIGLLLKPHCFVRNRINIALINIIWKHNKKAWIITVIMLKWLT